MLYSSRLSSISMKKLIINKSNLTNCDGIECKLKSALQAIKSEESLYQFNTELTNLPYNFKQLAQSILRIYTSINSIQTRYFDITKTMKKKVTYKWLKTKLLLLLWQYQIKITENTDINEEWLIEKEMSNISIEFLLHLRGKTINHPISKKSLIRDLIN